MANRVSVTDERVGPVVPLIAPDEKGRPALVGSACAVRSDSNSYLISAGHVVQPAIQAGLFTPYQGGLVPIRGHVISAAQGSPLTTSNEDLDLGVIRLSEGRPDFRAVALRDIDLSAVPASFPRVAFAGWPASRARSRVAVKTVRAEPQSLIVDVVAEEGYARWSLHPEVHILARFQRESFVDSTGRPVGVADPHGMSGGGIFGCAAGRPAHPVEVVPLLGVIVGFKGREEYIFGMRMNICVALMCKLDPTIEQCLSDRSRSDPTLRALVGAPIHP